MKSLEMRSFFAQCGYPSDLLDTTIQRVFKVSRSDILKPLSEQISTEKIPLALTFHSFNYKVRDIIIQDFDILKNYPETSAIFTGDPLISFRHNNIRDSLIHNAIKQNSSLPAGTFSCS